jgi:hypothetical protein
MAVRNFDVSDPTPEHLRVVTSAPLSRRAQRSARQRAAIVSTAALLVPFVLAVLLLGVGH